MPSSWSTSTWWPITSNSRGTTLICRPSCLLTRITSISPSWEMLEKVMMMRSTMNSPQTCSKRSRSPRWAAVRLGWEPLPFGWAPLPFA